MKIETYGTRQVLVLEPSLVENAGHHHTQIGALSQLLPEFKLSVLAGPTCSDFPGFDLARLDSKAIRVRKLQLRADQGAGLKSLYSRLRFLATAKNGRSSRSSYGDSLIKYCLQRGLSASDVIVVPSADIDALESAAELYSVLKQQCPLICLRFLTPCLGVRSDSIRIKRLAAIPEEFLDRTVLFTETVELAAHLRRTLGLPFTGGFYLPCSIGSDVDVNAVESDFFRVGVFGAPKARKGSARVAAIIRKTEAIISQESNHKVKFVIQGRERDFAETGAYRQVRSNNGNLVVSRLPAELTPSKFQEMFMAVDAVMLPYDVSTYGLQGSGVVQDAVMGLKLIIHSERLSMTNLLDHGNAFPAKTDDDFAEVIAALARNRNQLKAGLVRAREYYEHCITEHPLREVIAV